MYLTFMHCIDWLEVPFIHEGKQNNTACFVSITFKPDHLSDSKMMNALYILYQWEFGVCTAIFSSTKTFSLSHINTSEAVLMRLTVRQMVSADWK